MSATRHRRLQKTRKRYEHVLRRLARWPHQLDKEVWDHLHSWRGHGPQGRPTTLDLIYSIPPEETPFGKMVLNGHLSD